MNEQVQVMALGAQIHAERGGRGWSRRRLAREAGVTEATIRSIEHGAPATIATLTRLAAALELRLVLQKASA